MNTPANTVLTLHSLSLADLHPALLCGFIRDQTVRQAWRGPHGHWQLQPVCFSEHWDDATLAEIACQDLAFCLRAGGAVWLMRDGVTPVAFAALSRSPFGSLQQYVALQQLHVSQRYRNQGLGRQLLELAAGQARNWGATRLYASAHSSAESAGFYFHCGWIAAKELNTAHVLQEPADLQLELLL